MSFLYNNSTEIITDIHFNSLVDLDVMSNRGLRSFVECVRDWGSYDEPWTLPGGTTVFVSLLGLTWRGFAVFPQFMLIACVFFVYFL